jgi:peptidyl-prolyl cis-trans isomerase B (cyclophilin B)
MKKIIYIFVVMGMISCNTEKAYNVGQIITPEGEILIWLHNETPNHKASFTQLANDGYWDNYTFNRVIPNFVAQGGCPDTPEGFTDPEYLLEPEFDEKLIHEYGAVGAGRDDNPKKLSARCQFYIVHNKKGLSRLDGDYTIFGKVIKGMDVVNAIINKERDSTNTPLSDISLDVNMIKLKASELEKLYPEGIEVQ